MNIVVCKHERACPTGFDAEAAKALLDGWVPKDEAEWVFGNPMHAEVRRRWPRGSQCPDCGEVGIFYASPDHYVLGDW